MMNNYDPWKLNEPPLATVTDIGAWKREKEREQKESELDLWIDDRAPF